MATKRRRVLFLLGSTVALIAGCATGTSPLSDQSIESKVLTRIAQEPSMSAAQLTVRETNGAVSIGGFIDTLEQERLLESIIADVEGIDGVTSVADRTTMRTGS